MRLDSFELSKIAGAFLWALLVIFGFKRALEIAEHDKAPEKPGYVLPTPEAVRPPWMQLPEAAPQPRQRRHSIAAAVAQAAASGNAQAGAAVFKKCTACHTSETRRPQQGGPQPRRRRRPPEGEPRRALPIRMP